MAKSSKVKLKSGKSSRRKAPWNSTPHEESFLESSRRRVEEQYDGVRRGRKKVGGCFGTILCRELHNGHGLHFTALAEKWGIPVSLLGELIWDHCKRLEPQVQVNHKYRAPA